VAVGGRHARGRLQDGRVDLGAQVPTARAQVSPWHARRGRFRRMKGILQACWVKRLWSKRWPGCWRMRRPWPGMHVAQQTRRRALRCDQDRHCAAP